jgi:hypothetical protein
MAETKTDARPISPDQAADLIRDAGKVSGLAQIGILAHADELAAVQSVRLNRESLRLARRYGSGSPEAIQAGRRIDLHTSPKTPEMPDLVGMTESDARAALERLGVGSIRVTTKTAAGTAPGTVVKQTPAKGTALKSSTRVALVVSARPAVKMPDLRRMTFQQAIVRLNQLGLRIGKVTGGQGKGRITGQKPKAGEKVMPGGAVDLRLARARTR